MDVDREQAKEFSWGTAEHVKKHRLSTGILLTLIGTIYFIFGISGGWSEWQKQILGYPPSAFNCLIGFVTTLLFVANLLVLIIGIVLISTCDE
jgi:hypothetical protein